MKNVDGKGHSGKCGQLQSQISIQRDEVRPAIRNKTPVLRRV